MLLFCFYGLAYALDIEDDPIFGPGSIAHDAVTGLDWLRITDETTLGLGFTGVRGLLGTDDYADFRFSTESELDQLISNSGYFDPYPNSDCYALNSLIYDLGPTYESSTGSLSELPIHESAALEGMLEPTFLFNLVPTKGILIN